MSGRAQNKENIAPCQVQERPLTPYQRALRACRSEMARFTAIHSQQSQERLKREDLLRKRREIFRKFSRAPSATRRAQVRPEVSQRPPPLTAHRENLQRKSSARRVSSAPPPQCRLKRVDDHPSFSLTRPVPKRSMSVDFVRCRPKTHESIPGPTGVSSEPLSSTEEAYQSMASLLDRQKRDRINLERRMEKPCDLRIPMQASIGGLLASHGVRLTAPRELPATPLDQPGSQRSEEERDLTVNVAPMRVSRVEHVALSAPRPCLEFQQLLREIHAKASEAHAETAFLASINRRIGHDKPRHSSATLTDTSESFRLFYLKRRAFQRLKTGFHEYVADRFRTESLQRSLLNVLSREVTNCCSANACADRFRKKRILRSMTEKALVCVSERWLHAQRRFTTLKNTFSWWRLQRQRYKAASLVAAERSAAMVQRVLAAWRRRAVASFFYRIRTTRRLFGAWRHLVRSRGSNSTPLKRVTIPTARREPATAGGSEDARHIDSQITEFDGKPLLDALDLFRTNRHRHVANVWSRWCRAVIERRFEKQIWAVAEAQRNNFLQRCCWGRWTSQFRSRREFARRIQQPLIWLDKRVALDFSRSAAPPYTGRNDTPQSAPL
jgi:hypothetical protein